ncbi:MAG: hypothetical protein ACP5HJ_00560 [Candidatus Micrarchaeia archaeon]|jgi:hypothetical protein
MPNVLKTTFSAYFKNLKQILFFSFAFLITFSIPIFAGMPTYLALGGIFLRSGGIFLTVTLKDITIIILSMFLSLFFLSIGIVAINLLIKAQKAYTKTSKSKLAEFSIYTFKVFLIFSIFSILQFLFSLIGYLYNIQEFVYLALFIFSLFIFYAPAGIVIDEFSIFSSLIYSFKFIFKKPQYFLIWLIFGSLSIILVTFISSAFQGFIFNFPIGEFLALSINSFFVAPLLIILQAESFLRKYPLFKK